MTWLATYSGAEFSLIDPQPDQVRIGDIAHSLSQLCRFVGATRSFYSVAQHCVLVSDHCPPEYAFAGLMHDAAEAYCLDMPRPLKYLPAWRRTARLRTGFTALCVPASAFPR
jgi:hypothetical protein